MSDALFWDKIAPRYAKDPIKNMAAYEATLDRVRETLRPEHRVVELGCGTGTTALKLAGSAAEYIATDVSPGMIEIARGKEATARTPGLRFDVAGASASDFAENSVDRVLGFNLLHLVRDLDQCLAASYAMLKPGGLFITKTACLRNMSPFIRLAIPVMQLFGKAPFVHIFSRNALEQRIKAAGFDIDEARSFPGAPATWFVIARKPG